MAGRFHGQKVEGAPERRAPGGTRMSQVFGPPHGITFDVSKKDGVETEGAGAEQVIRMIEADANSFRCEWYAKKEKGGVDGHARGYFWIAIKK
jgi:hypothetical protein